MTKLRKLTTWWRWDPMMSIQGRSWKKYPKSVKQTSRLSVCAGWRGWRGVTVMEDPHLPWYFQRSCDFGWHLRCPYAVPRTGHRGDYGGTASPLATGNRTPPGRWLGLGGKSPIPTGDEAERGATRSIPAPTGTKPTLPSLHPAYPATPTRASYRLQADPSGRHTCGEGALGARRRKPSCHPGSGNRALGVMVLPRSGWARAETRVRRTLCAVGCTLNRNRKSCGRVTCPEVTSVEGVARANAESVPRLCPGVCVYRQTFGWCCDSIPVVKAEKLGLKIISPHSRLA